MCKPALIVREHEELVQRVGSMCQSSASFVSRTVKGVKSYPIVETKGRGNVLGQNGQVAGVAHVAGVGGAGPKGEPLVSVIVPCYNLGAYLPECLDSLQRQTFQDFETIIVDDGSTDDASLRLLDMLKDQGWHVVRKPNGGLSSARNRGIAEARGTWIVPLDCDDVLHPTCLEKLVAVKRADPELAIVSTLVRYFVDDVEEVCGGWVPFGFDLNILAHRNCASNACALMDREALLAIGGYDEWLTSYEDWDVQCSLASRGGRSAILPVFLYYYRVRPTSMMREEGMHRHYCIKAYLAQKHPRLSSDPSWTLRMQMAEADQYKQEAVQYKKQLEYLQCRVAEMGPQAESVFGSAADCA